VPESQEKRIWIIATTSTLLRQRDDGATEKDRKMPDKQEVNDPPRKRTKKNQKGKRPGQTYQRETVAEASLRKHINGGKPPRCGVQDTIRDFEASHSMKSPRASLAEAPVVKHMFAWVLDAELPALQAPLDFAK
jgi:hypothetical protein